MAFDDRTTSEVLYDTLKLLKEVREDMRGALALLDHQIESLEVGGHLPSPNLLQRLGYYVEGEGGRA